MLNFLSLQGIATGLFIGLSLLKNKNHFKKYGIGQGLLKFTGKTSEPERVSKPIPLIKKSKAMVKHSVFRYPSKKSLTI